jgi:hypothetical protein
MTEVLNHPTLEFPFLCPLHSFFCSNSNYSSGSRRMNFGSPIGFVPLHPVLAATPPTSSFFLGQSNLPPTSSPTFNAFLSPSSSFTPFQSQPTQQQLQPFSTKQTPGAAKRKLSAEVQPFPLTNQTPGDYESYNLERRHLRKYMPQQKRQRPGQINLNVANSPTCLAIVPYRPPEQIYEEARIRHEEREEGTQYLLENFLPASVPAQTPSTADMAVSFFC